MYVVCQYNIIQYIVVESYLFIVRTRGVNCEQMMEFALKIDFQISYFSDLRWNKSYFCNCRNGAVPGQIILLDKEPNPVSSYFDQ